jgi:hypothetical protein
MYRAPLFPYDEDPVLNTNIPVAPDVPALAVWINMVPLVVKEL